jgi:hypothetical protein
MRRVTAFMLMAVLCSAISAADPMPAVTTSDGKTFKNATVLKVEDDRVLLNYTDGGAWVPLAALSDETRKSLGLRSRAEQAAFEAAQKEKGLIKVGDEWITPGQKQAREAAAAAAQKAASQRAAREAQEASRQAEDARRQAAFEARLTELVPDWREIAAKPGFPAWLNGTMAASAIARTSVTYRMMLERAERKGDVAGAAWVYEEWRENERELLRQGSAYRGGDYGGSGPGR